MTQVDHATLTTVPAHVTGMSTFMLGAGHALGGQDQELFDELTRELPQQVLDR